VSYFFEGGADGPYLSNGNAPSPAYLDDFVASDEGLRLMKAFMRVRPALQRWRAKVTLASALFGKSRQPLLSVPSYPRKVEGFHMKRREFVTLLGGATVAWSVGAHAQQRRIAVLVPGRENDPV
jgi:hypothetical protein